MQVSTQTHKQIRWEMGCRAGDISNPPAFRGSMWRWSALWRLENRGKTKPYRGSRNAKRLMGDWEEWDSKPLIVAGSREDQQIRGKGVEDRVGLQRPWWDMRVRVPNQLPGHCPWWRQPEMPMMETAWNLPQPGVEVCIQIQFRKTLT